MSSRAKAARWPILFRLLVSFVLIGVLGSFLLAYVYVRSSMRLMEQSLIDQAEEHLLRIRGEFDRDYAAPMRTHIRLLRDSVALNSFNAAPGNPQFKRSAELLFLHSMRSSQPLYKGIAFVDADDRSVLDLRSLPQSLMPAEARHVLLDRLRKAPADSLLLSPPLQQDGSWSVLVGIGYFYPNSERYSGAVIAQCDLNELLHALNDTQIAQLPICWTFDPAGKLLAAPASNPLPYDLVSPTSLSEGAFIIRGATLDVDDQAVFQAVLKVPEDPYAGHLRETVRRTVLVLVLVLVLATILAVTLSRQISRPISQLIALSEQVSDGDYSIVAPSASGELGTLVDSFNHMLSTIRQAHVASARQKQALLSLNDRLSLFRDLINQSNDWVLVVEPDSCRLIDANTQACSALGYTREEVLAMSFGDLPISPAGYLDWDDLLLRMRRGSHIVFTVDFAPENEDVQKLEVNAKYIPHGESHYVVAVARDSTERLQIEGAYRDSEAYFRDLFEGSPDAIFIESHDGMVLDANPAATALHEMVRNELIGKHVTELVPPYLREVVRREFPKLVTSELTHFEAFSYKKNGDAIPVEVRVSQVTRQGSPALLLRVTNISKRKKAEDALAEAHQELLLTQQKVVQQERLCALGKMASGIAHEFNNSLTSILGFSELLLLEKGAIEDHARVRLYLEHIQTVSRDAGQIVRRLSDFYRKRKATATINHAIEIDRLVEQTIELTRPRWQLQARRVGKRVEIVTETRANTTIAGSEAELRELFTNLIFNATDAITKDGTITMTTYCEGGEVVVKVADTGEGMPPDVLARCFEPFYTTKDEKGSGLGMAIVYGIVQRHKGQIEVDSVADLGTVIGIRLPITHGEQASAPIEEGKVIRGLRILLVEDKAHVRDYLGQVLTLDGHIVTQAVNGSEGLETFEPEAFDLVVTGRSILEISGDQMALGIREQVPDQPIIMITGFGNLMRATEDLPVQFNAILGKPCTRNDIRGVIRKVIG